MTRPGIVLCSRVHSRRLPNKPLIEFRGKPVIWWLCKRLIDSNVPVCLAIPTDSEDDALVEATNGLERTIFRGHRDNVLARLYWAAVENDFDHIVRVTHDDLFVDTDMMKEMIEFHIKEKADYTFVSKCMRGADCEIVSRSFVERALKMHGDQEGEFLSYTFRRPELNPVMRDFEPSEDKKIHARLVMDWPEDVLAIKIVSEHIGMDNKNEDLVFYLKDCPSVLEVNKLPMVSVYTCAYNAEETINRCVDSILSQKTNFDSELILLDDDSDDKTPRQILGYTKDRRVRAIRNEKNIGLASSCNVALKEAKGKYLLRLDADDELLEGALQNLVDFMQNNKDVVAAYPAYFQSVSWESLPVIQNTAHHMGGAMIRSWAYHELKFCDGMRQLEGQEFYNRLVKRFKAAEYPEPTWIYHQRKGSLSKSNPIQRETLKYLIS